MPQTGWVVVLHDSARNTFAARLVPDFAAVIALPEAPSSLFTALRRRGVPAELLDFPDEGHWVLAPKSSRYWHEQVFRFLRTWLGR